MQRPDLTNADILIREYIEFLESKIAASRMETSTGSSSSLQAKDDYSFTEPPTTANILTFSQSGVIKRTHRHHYYRQHRGGMGIFDLETPASDPPIFLVGAEQNQTLLLFSDRARVFRYPLSKIEESPPRSKGQFLDHLPLEPNERIVAAIPERASGYLALASRKGFVRCLRHHMFGEHLKPGTSMYHLSEFGPLAAICWTSGDDDLFLVSMNGMAIRFNEKSLPPQGSKGINLAQGDQLVAVTAIQAEGQVCILSADGKGTSRLMTGFAPNKSPGGIGKIAMKATRVVAAVAASPESDLFLLSRQAKIIRFLAGEIPTTEGAVQGVNCMLFRNDEVVAATLGTALF